MQQDSLAKIQEINIDYFKQNIHANDFEKLQKFVNDSASDKRYGKVMILFGGEFVKKIFIDKLMSQISGAHYVEFVKKGTRLNPYIKHRFFWKI